MLTPEFIRPHFDAGLAYDQYVTSGTPDQAAKWRAFHGRVSLTPAQRTLVAGFTRRVNVLVVSGLWCGDCVQQCPLLAHLAAVKPAPRGEPEAPGVDLRFVDRDRHSALSDAVRICGGNRVPTVIFLNEDLEFTGIAGDRSLSRLRALASRQLGAMCPLPGAPVPADEVADTLADWAGELERQHLLVRLSPKLRERHAD
jgi:hypothetical protein